MEFQPLEIRDREIAALSSGRLITREDAEAAQKNKDHNFDSYATSKSVSQNLLNTASIQYLIVIVFSILTRGTALTRLDVALLCLISLSLSLQFSIFVFLVVLAQSRTETLSCGCTATSLNSAVTCLSGLLLIVTSAISVSTIGTAITNGSNATTVV